MSEAGAAPACLRHMDVVILAGGLGTRLAGTVPDLPKILAPVAETPFLRILLDWLRGFGARRVVLGLGHRAEPVLDYLSASPPPGLDVTAAVEPEPAGTAGAIRFLRPRLMSDPVLVLNGDSFVDADLCEFVAAHERARARASLMCVEVADAGRYGAVAVDDGGRITRFKEKNPAGGPGAVNAGVYLFGPEFLDMVDAMPGRSLEADVFAALPAGMLHGHRVSGAFIDIGTPEDYARAAETLAPYLPA